MINKSECNCVYRHLCWAKDQEECEAVLKYAREKESITEKMARLRRPAEPIIVGNIIEKI